MSPVNHWEDVAQQILGHRKAVCQPLTISPTLAGHWRQPQSVGEGDGLAGMESLSLDKAPTASEPWFTHLQNGRLNSQNGCDLSRGKCLSRA